MSTITLINGATTTGAGSDFPTKTHANHASVIFFTHEGGGSCTALVVDIEGSIDGTNWCVLDTHTFSAGDLTAQCAYVFTTGKVVNFMRADITTLTNSGGTTTVTVKHRGV
jgi:hypothetical protein